MTKQEWEEAFGRMGGSLNELMGEEAIASVQIDGEGYEGPDAVECQRCGKKFHPNYNGVHTCSPRKIAEAKEARES